MGFNTVLYVKEGGVGKITLNRPREMNSLSNELISELNSLIAQVEDDKDVRVLVICGTEKAFCCGADLREASTSRSPDDAVQFLQNLSNTFRRIEELRKPVIAAIGGLALGGGLELALACDLRICSSSAMLGVPEIKVGLIPLGGGIRKLPKMVGISKATEMIMTGEAITAEEAHRLGLINTVIPPDNLMQEVNRIASKLLAYSPLTLGVAKSAIKVLLNIDAEAGVEFERTCAAFLFSTEDQKEGIKAFVEKRKPIYVGR